MKCNKLTTRVASYLAVATMSENVTTQHERATPRTTNAMRRERRLSEGRKGRKGAGPATNKIHIATRMPVKRIVKDVCG